MRGIQLKRSASNRKHSSLDVIILLIKQDVRCIHPGGDMFNLRGENKNKNGECDAFWALLVCACGSLLLPEMTFLLIWLLTLYLEQRADYGWLAANKYIIIYKWGVPCYYIGIHYKIGKWSVSQVHIARADMAEQPDKRET